MNVCLKGFNYETLYNNSIILEALNDTFNIDLAYEKFSPKYLNKSLK